MPSAISLLAVFSIVVFAAGSACGALAVLIISIHRAGRASLSGARRQRGAISRCMLVKGRR